MYVDGIIYYLAEHAYKIHVVILVRYSTLQMRVVYIMSTQPKSVVGCSVYLFCEVCQLHFVAVAVRVVAYFN